MSSVSQILRQTREHKGISLDEVARRTYIKHPYLVALEEGAVDDLPAPVFVHGYIRQYAKLLGLNAAELVHQYQQEVRHEPLPLVLAPVLAMADQNTQIQGPAGNSNGHSNGFADNGNGDPLAEACSRPEPPADRSGARRLQALERTVPVMSETGGLDPTTESGEIAEARQQAQRIVAEAQREAQQLRRESERYAHQVLSELEAEIGRALATVRNGRQFLHQQRRRPPSPTIG